MKAPRLLLLVLPLALGACGPAAVMPPITPNSSGGANPAGLLGSSAAAPAQPQASISGKIAFARNGDIWVYQGSSAKQATHSGSAADPAWSPDGQTLAFDEQSKNSSDLFVMPYPQGTAKQLTRDASTIVDNNLWAMQPDWSPDSQTLAFISDRGRARSGTLDPAVWSLSISSGAVRQLSSANVYTGGVDFPRWRPNHPTQILYASWSYEPTTLQPYAQLMLLDTHTGAADALTPAGQTAMQPSWSPDGASIVYLDRSSAKADDLRVMTLAEQPVASDSEDVQASPSATTPATQAVLQNLQAAHPVWSPDGHAIAYLTLKDGSFDLFTVDVTPVGAAAGTPKQLTTGLHLDAASSISWSA